MKLFYKVMAAFTAGACVFAGIYVAEKREKNYKNQNQALRDAQSRAEQAAEEDYDDEPLDPDEEVYSTGPQPDQGYNQQPYGQPGGFNPGYNNGYCGGYGYGGYSGQAPRNGNQNQGYRRRNQQKKKEPQTKTEKAIEGLKTMQDLFVRISAFVNSLVVIVDNLGRMFSAPTTPVYSPTMFV
jgi:hypothetical protein